MSYKLYNRTECNLSIELETTRRTGAAVEINAIPTDIFEEIEIPEPFKEWEEKFPVNVGRNIGAIGDKTYPAADGSLEMNLQTATWLFYALGASADVLAIFWTHTITEANDLPSFKVHFQQTNGGAGGNIIRDLIGCFVTELKLAVAKDGLVTQSLSFIVPKSVAGVDFSGITWESFNHSDKLMNWEMTELDNFNINSVDLITTWGNVPIESLELTITNEIDLLPNLGDAWLDEPKIGKRHYELKLNLYPKDDDLYVARNLHPEDYTGAITIVFNRGTNDTITLTFSDMYVSDYPNKIPNSDDKAVGVEVTFRNSPGGTLGVIAEDDKDESYYDGVDDTP